MTDDLLANGCLSACHVGPAAPYGQMSRMAGANRQAARCMATDARFGSQTVDQQVVLQPLTLVKKQSSPQRDALA